MAIADGPVVVGGGPSGLAAAIELRDLGISPVTVIEREREAGGIPRHSDHTGFGLRDLRTLLSGPTYAQRYRELAEKGVEVVTETMVTDWEGPRRLKLTGPGGREEIEPPAVILATGCRERPRSARFVPGSRPAGVMTTSTLQQLVHLRGPEGGPARSDRRRRARQLLGGRDSGPRRRLRRRAGHGAAAPSVAARRSAPEPRSATGRRSGPGQRSARSTAPSGSSRSSSPSSSPAAPGRSTATWSSSPRTGSPTTSWR